MLPGLASCIMSMEKRMEEQKEGGQISRKTNANEIRIHRLDREFLSGLIRESFVKSWALEDG